MNKTQELETIFSILHDGYIESYKIEDSKIMLKIGIQYLAELLNPKFEFINLSIVNVESLSFNAWSDNPLVLTEPNEIFNLGIGILRAETNDLGQVVIHTYCDNSPNNEFGGGGLIIKCQDYHLTDQENNLLTFEKLKEMTSYYWNGKKDKSI